MGYRKTPIIYTMEIEKYEGLTVRMKGVSVGKVRKLVRLSSSDETSTGDVIDEIIRYITENLVSWNLEDEQGVPLPAVAEQVEELDYGMLSAVLDAWLDKITGVDEELGKDSSSGEKFPGLSATMEAL